MRGKPLAVPRKAGSTGGIPNAPGPDIPPRSGSMPASMTLHAEPKLGALQEEEGGKTPAAPARKAGSTGDIPNPPGPDIQPRSASMPAATKQSDREQPQLEALQEEVDAEGKLLAPPTGQTRKAGSTGTGGKQSDGEEPHMEEEEEPKGPTDSTGATPNQPGPDAQSTLQVDSTGANPNQPRSASMPASVSLDKQPPRGEPQLEALQEEAEGKSEEDTEGKGGDEGEAGGSVEGSQASQEEEEEEGGEEEGEGGETTD